MTSAAKDLKHVFQLKHHVIQTFQPGGALPSRTHFTELIEDTHETAAIGIKDVMFSMNSEQDVPDKHFHGGRSQHCHFIISDDWELTSLELKTFADFCLISCFPSVGLIALSESNSFVGVKHIASITDTAGKLQLFLVT